MSPKIIFTRKLTIIYSTKLFKFFKNNELSLSAYQVLREDKIEKRTIHNKGLVSGDVNVLRA